MFEPGTWTWAQAVPAFLVALMLLLGPGFAAARLLRLTPTLAAGLAPALTISFLTVGGAVAGRVGYPWGWLPVILTTVASWLLAAALGAGLAHRRRVPAPALAPRSHDEPALPERWVRTRWVQAAGTAAGVGFAFLLVLRLLWAISPTPDMFPQHPDINFHLNVPMWMVQNADVSYFHAGTLTTGVPSGGYPIGWQALVATVALLADVPVVVASSVTVLAVAGIVWPLGLVCLARVLLGRTASVSGAAGVVSVMFTAFPFMLMVFGVLYSNFLGGALIPGMLAVSASLVDRMLPAERADEPAPAVAIAGVLAVLGLSIAHPNALVSWLVFSVVMLVVAAVRRGLRRRDQRLRARWWPAVLAGGLLVIGAVGSVVVRPEGMVATGTPGPEAPRSVALWDTLLFAPRESANLTVLALLVAVGAVAVATCYRRALWAAPATAGMMLLFYLNVAVDDDLSRYATWPWYNNAVRLAAVGAPPAAVLATAALVGLGTGATRRLRSPQAWGTLATAVLTVLLVVVTQGYYVEKRDWMKGYYQPGELRSWARPYELESLYELAQLIPEDAVVAANPWNGGTFLYVMTGTDLLYPTEKARLSTPERELLAGSLYRAGTDASVCAAAQRAGVTHAVVGGHPFHWGIGQEARAYSGIDAVGSYSAWRLVASAEPYRLYELVSCAGAP